MKILELTRSFYPSIGGMEKFVADRLKIYDSLGYDYNVITTNHIEKKINEAEQNFVKHLKSYTPYEITPQLSNAMKTDYDVLSVNQIGYYYSEYAIRQAFKKNKKIILTPHYYFHTNKYKVIKKIHSKYILPKTLSLVDSIICFTEIEKKFWIKNFPNISEKIKIIPHYINQPDINLKTELLPQKDFLLYLGRVEKNKRLDLLLNAFNEVNINYDLYLTFSNNELSSSLQKIVKENKKIKLLGTVSEEEKHSLLTKCSALVLPTEYEAFGIVNLEASFYKKPLIISDLEIFKDVLNPNGVLFFKNNSNSIRTSLEYFARLSTEDENKMGMINFENLSNYSFSKIKNDYQNLFKKLHSN